MHFHVFHTYDMQAHRTTCDALLLQTLEKLKRQLADADAALEARKKPPEDAGPRIIGEGLVIDEWVSYQGWHFSTSPCEFLFTMPNLCLFHLYRKSEGKDTLLSSRLTESSRYRGAVVFKLPLYDE